MPPEAPLYRSVGKTFILTKRTDIEQRLETEMVNNTKSQRDLESQKEFLDRRITSTLQHMKEIATGN
jgi:chaperonin cofactor prefoldin